MGGVEWPGGDTPPPPPSGGRRLGGGNSKKILIRASNEPLRAAKTPYPAAADTARV